jgi:hypothetical protein
MADYDNTNTWALFKNDKREEGSKQPEYRGTLNVNGEEYEIAAWVRTSKKDGSKFFSGTVKPPFKKTERTSYDEPAKQLRDVMDDEIPF